MNSYVLGATIGFSSTFVDETGAALSPAGATLRLEYKAGSVATLQSVAMTMNAGVASYSWDSSVADKGAVYWHAEATGSIRASNQGAFRLVANPANPGY